MSGAAWRLPPFLESPAWEAVRKGETTDVYFDRTHRILQELKLDRTPVYAEVTCGEVPSSPWGVFTGVAGVLELLRGLPVNVYAVPEGTVFAPKDEAGIRVPLLAVEGPYGTWGRLETATLGLLCQPSGITSATARVRRAAGDLPLLSFGTRRMHPYLAAVVDYYAFVGGCDSVSAVFSARVMGKRAVGTMPHALMLVAGSDEEAWAAFDAYIERDVPRIALVDTFRDEKFGALSAAERLGKKLVGVRLDTPGSRRGDFVSLVQEVRHALDEAGHAHVKIYVSGGLDAASVRELRAAGARGFGVGTSVAGAPPVDFSLDIVEVEGRTRVKRGKFGGRKTSYRCFDCFRWFVFGKDRRAPGKCPHCGGSLEQLLKPLMQNGRPSGPQPSADELRDAVLAQLKRMPDPYGALPAGWKP
ncbi:MAG TPA: nicotinate phosphoribosyltransferase [Candidatus Thermoplasmatota archaeon]